MESSDLLKPVRHIQQLRFLQIIANQLHAHRQTCRANTVKTDRNAHARQTGQ